MRRRDFVTLVGGTAATWALAARAQPAPRMRRIGVLLFAAQDQTEISPFLRALETLGYVDGKTVVIEYRTAEGSYERIAEAANELVRLDPDVIFALGADVAPAIKKATAAIPIVVVVSNDPVETGLVASLARPGGNITGLTFVHDQLAGKSVELLKDTVPWVSRVAVLWNPDHADPEFQATQRAAQTLGVQLQSLVVRQPGDFDIAFPAAERERAEALIVLWGRFISSHQQEIGDFAAKNRLIMVGAPSYVTDIGGLLSYGPNVPELLRLASIYVDKILKGARPADLPMQQPTTFELTINLKAAKSLGLTLPPTVMARADKVIE